MGAAVGALVITTLVGAAHLHTEAPPLERASPQVLGVIGPSLDVEAPLADVPIVPPGDDLTGELAPVVPSQPPFAAARRGGSGDVFALVVGINDYPGSKHDLRAAVADADTVDAALAGFGVPAANRVVLRDGQARRAQIVASLQALASTAGHGSTVVFAYAGHARRLARDTAAIVAADGGLIRDHELAALLAPLTTQRVWLLMASCFGGNFTEALGPGRVLTAAAGPSSLAYESPDLQGSYLVHHLVREGWLEGQAGPSVQEAFAFAQARIRDQYPNRAPMEIDQLGQPMRLGMQSPGRSRPPSSAPPSNPPPGSSPPVTEPPKKTCTLLVLCR